MARAIALTAPGSMRFRGRSLFLVGLWKSNGVLEMGKSLRKVLVAFEQIEKAYLTMTRNSGYFVKNAWGRGVFRAMPFLPNHLGPL